MDLGAKGGLCDDAILFLEGMKRFVDVFGLPGYKFIQISIVTVQSLLVLTMPMSFQKCTKWRFTVEASTH